MCSRLRLWATQTSTHIPDAASGVPNITPGAEAKGSFLRGRLPPSSPSTQPPTCARRGACRGVGTQRGGTDPAHLQKGQEGGLGGAGLPQHGHRSAQVVDVAAVGVQHHGLRELGTGGGSEHVPPTQARTRGPTPGQAAPATLLPAFARQRCGPRRRGAERPRALRRQPCAQTPGVAVTEQARSRPHPSHNTRFFPSKQMLPK